MLVSTVAYADTIDLTGSASAKAEPTAHIMGTYLSEGTAEITKLSSNKVHILGVTDCARTSSKVYLYLYLEQKVNGSYASYKSWKFTKENADILAKGIDVTVKSGYYYRVRGYHAAESNGIKESVSTLTGGIMVK